MRKILTLSLLLFSFNGWAEQFCKVDVPNIKEVGELKAWTDTVFDIEMNCEGAEILRVEFQPFNHPKTQMIDSIVTMFCDFKEEILIREKIEFVGVEYPSIMCSLNYHLRRMGIPKSEAYKRWMEMENKMDGDGK